MLKLIVVGIVAGITVQAFRNFPPDGPVTPNSAALIALVGLAAAYGAGRARRRWGPAVAVASASAESTALAAARADQRLAVQINLGGGARPVGVVLPDEDTAPWLKGASERREVTADDLDGMDLYELLEGDEHTTA